MNKDEINYIIKLLEKDIPKKPVIEHGGIWCPHCKTLFNTVKTPYGNAPVMASYCENCGQRLDWGEW